MKNSQAVTSRLLYLKPQFSAPQLFHVFLAYKKVPYITKVFSSQDDSSDQLIYPRTHCLANVGRSYCCNNLGQFGIALLL